MTKITIVNKKTAWGRTKHYLGVGFAILTVYSGFVAVNSWNDNRYYEKNMKAVEKAINSGDKELAVKTLEEFKEKKLLRERETAILETILVQRLNELYDFNARTVEELIAKKSYDDAEGILNIFSSKKLLRETDESLLRNTLESETRKTQYFIDFKNLILSNGLSEARNALMNARTVFNDEEYISRLEQLLHDHTEQGFIERINYARARNGETARLLSQYLQMYPETKLKEYAIRTVIVNYFVSLNTCLENNYPLEEVYAKLSELNSLLSIYSAENIDLSEITVFENLVTKTNTYLENNNADTTLDLTVGSRVRIRPSTETVLSSDTGQEYLKQRNRTFPAGSVGTIVGDLNDMSDSSKFYVVEFEGTTEYYWEGDWGPLSKFWKNEEKNAAAYRLEELIPASMNQIEKNNFLQELERTKELIKQYD